MNIYCFDSDKSTEKVIKDSIVHNDFNVDNFYFNEKISNIHTSTESCSDTIVFLNTRIQIKNQNAFDLAVMFRERMKDCHIVFLSSHPEDMAHCFKNLVRPSGFIIKPLSIAEITSVISAIESCHLKDSQTKIFHISTHDYKRNVEMGDISYFSTSGKKIFCRLRNGEKIEFYNTISNLEKEYSEDFLRCHSGFLVNRHSIKGLRRGELELADCPESIPISKRYRLIIKDVLSKK